MSTIINTTFQFKKGLAARWTEVNPILKAGEPGFVVDENRLKIGDGETHWNDLPYIGESNVVDVETRYDLPSVGRVNTIYKIESEKKTYMWSTATSSFEFVGLLEASGSMPDIEIIHGGEAAIKNKE